MKDQPTLCGYQYVRRSVRRQHLMRLLSQPMTPAHLAQQAGLTTKAACKVVAELREHGLIECLTPNIQRGRLYARTTLGESVWSLIKKRSASEPPANKLPAEDHLAYASVCYRHRSVVVRGLGMPRQASQIKHWIRSNLPGAKISANNVRDVLRKLIRIGIVYRTNSDHEYYPVYALTKRGQRFRDLLDQAMSLPADQANDSLLNHYASQERASAASGGGDE